MTFTQILQNLAFNTNTKATRSAMLTCIQKVLIAKGKRTGTPDLRLPRKHRGLDYDSGLGVMLHNINYIAIGCDEMTIHSNVSYEITYYETALLKSIFFDVVRLCHKYDIIDLNEEQF